MAIKTTTKAATIKVLDSKNKSRIPITETGSKDIIDEWYHRSITAEQFPEFIRELTEKYSHDYGTICHAMAAAAIAAAKVVDRTDQGGITGFQAGAVMWEFIKHWQHIDGPATLLQYKNLLYPQYENYFNTISTEIWEWVQEEAKKNLAKNVHPVSQSITDHWKSIVEGRVPAGLKVKDE